jgi:hypothetical protein
MYNGIEIEHPVFRVLFCNLIAALFASAFNVIVYPVAKEIKYSKIANGINGLSLMFHCCCWLVVSLLRYIYIIHKDWLFKTFPDQKFLNRLAITSVFLAYIFCSLVLFVVCMLCGWPRLKLIEMPMPQKAISLGTFFGIYILLIGLSCSFYLTILKKKGRLKSNKVGNNISEVNVINSCLEMTTNPFGNVRIGDSHTNGTFQQDDQRQHQVTLYK